MEQLYDLTQRRLMLHRAMTVTTVFIRYGFHALIMAAMWMSFHRIIDLFTDIIKEDHFHQDDGSLTVIGSSSADAIAECTYRAVIPGSDPLSDHVFKAIDIYRSTGFLAIFEHQLFASKLDCVHTPNHRNAQTTLPEQRK